ncbi:hypothetical protein ISCGN_000772 [Ixodes scapularis]
MKASQGLPALSKNNGEGLLVGGFRQFIASKMMMSMPTTTKTGPQRLGRVGGRAPPLDGSWIAVSAARAFVPVRHLTQMQNGSVRKRLQRTACRASTPRKRACRASRRRDFGIPEQRQPRHGPARTRKLSALVTVHGAAAHPKDARAPRSRRSSLPARFLFSDGLLLLHQLAGTTRKSPAILPALHFTFFLLFALDEFPLALCFSRVSSAFSRGRFGELVVEIRRRLLQGAVSRAPGYGTRVCVTVAAPEKKKAEDRLFGLPNGDPPAAAIFHQQFSLEPGAPNLAASLLHQKLQAANPGATLSDFVRWYSPRDWIAPVVDPVTGKTLEEGHLSHRMQLPGNTWQEVWSTARAVPAHRQKRLFDDTKEAEKVLYYLLSLRPAEIVKHLMPILIHCALSHIIDNAHNGPRSLTTFLEQAVTKIAAQLRTKEPKFRELLGLLYEAEVAVARLESLRKKFGAGQEAADKLAASPGYIAPRRSHSSGTARLADTKKQAANQVDDFVLELVDNTEVEVSGAGGGPIGRTITQLFCESQKGSDSASESEEDQEPKFASPAGREYILRARCACPTPAARATPQRLYCVVAGNDFRLAGAFTHDAVFY